MMNIYCMYDKVATTYGPLFLKDNDGILTRDLKNQIKSNDQIKQIATDLIVMQVGTYEPRTGIITSTAPKTILEIGELVKNIEKEKSKDGK